MLPSFSDTLNIETLLSYPRLSYTTYLDTHTNAYPVNNVKIDVYILIWLPTYPQTDLLWRSHIIKLLVYHIVSLYKILHQCNHFCQPLILYSWNKSCDRWVLPKLLGYLGVVLSTNWRFMILTYTDSRIFDN